MALHKPRVDGSTIYDHCKAVYETTGKWPEEFPEPDVPEEGSIIWDWYWELRKAASNGFSGPNPLSFLEIEAWMRLMKIDLHSKSLQLILIMDQQYLSCWYTEQKKNLKKG